VAGDTGEPLGDVDQVEEQARSGRSQGTDGLYALGAASIALLAVIRIIWVALAHERPDFGTNGPSDLLPIMELHAALRGWYPLGVGELVLSKGLKPPLYHLGTALLFWPFPSVPAWGPAAINAGALATSVALLYRALTRRIAAPAALAGVVAFLALPGVVGLSTRPGCEFVHGALLLGLLLRLEALVQGRSSERGLALGGLLGAGLLVKWSFAAYAVPPMALAAAVSWGRRGHDRERSLRTIAVIGVGLLVGLVMFVPWALVAGDPGQAMGVLSSEPVEQRGMLHGLSFYFREAGLWFTGPQAIPLGLVVGATVVARKARPDVGTWLCLAALAGMLLPHSWMAHRELRYLVPMAPLLCWLAIGSMGHVWSSGAPWRAGLLIAVTLLAVATLVRPPANPSNRWAAIDANPWELTVWPATGDFGVERFFADLREAPPGRSCALIEVAGERRDDLAVWLSTQVLARTVLPVHGVTAPPQSGRSCHWVVENALDFAEAEARGLRLRSELRLGSHRFTGGGREIRLWRTSAQ